MSQGLNTTSFGEGVYCYEFTKDNIERLKHYVKDWTAIIFKMPDYYFECCADLADGTHDGSLEFPPYCFIDQTIPSTSIMTTIETAKDVDFLLSENQVCAFQLTK